MDGVGLRFGQLEMHIQDGPAVARTGESGQQVLGGTLRNRQYGVVGVGPHLGGVGEVQAGYAPA